jgi:putative nucleotidyltransferase with HDIG domain
MQNVEQTNLHDNFIGTVKVLIRSLELKDPYTSGHSHRVYKICKELSAYFNLSESEQRSLEGGALLHDIGKIGIKDNILFKPSSLTFAEYQVMKEHVNLGAQIIDQIGCLEHCLEPILYHHERIDGKGYPHGLKGDSIPLIARIVCVADSYDAMTTNRVYTPARTAEQALEEMVKCAGTQFDTQVVKEFTKWWQKKYSLEDDIINMQGATLEQRVRSTSRN